MLDCTAEKNSLQSTARLLQSSPLTGLQESVAGLLKSDPAKVKSEYRRLNLQLTFHPTEAEPRAHYIVKGQSDLGALVFFYLRSRRQSAVLGSLRVR